MQTVAALLAEPVGCLVCVAHLLLAEHMHEAAADVGADARPVVGLRR